MEHRRQERGRTRGPLAASLLLHAAVLALVSVAGGSAPAPAKTKVYAVDIVSPPPNVAGEPPAAPLATQEPGPAASQPDPAPAEPAPRPEPPAPDPEPAPPREAPKEAPKEPAKAPEPRRTPERPATQPTQRPGTTPPRTNPADRPRNAERPKNADRPSGGSSTQSGTGSGSTRTSGGGTQTGAATGRNPDASSPGGEGLNIHVEGDPCPVARFCENVQRQVGRFFRPPPGTEGATGEICFRIQRNGSVTNMQPRDVRGGAIFELAMIEAAEMAGSRRAFGTLPDAFDPDRWRWCVELPQSRSRDE